MVRTHVLRWSCQDNINTKERPMNQKQYITEHVKGKHLTNEERYLIQTRLKDGHSAYRIAKEIGCCANTVRNEIQRGSVILYHGAVVRYKAAAGQARYQENRANSRRQYKVFCCSEFLKYVNEKFTGEPTQWSLDACFGRAQMDGVFSREQMVCTKTLYRYVDLGLLPIRNFNLPEKLQRNTKKAKQRVNKRILGDSIEQRPSEVAERNTFSHWEIDTVVGKRNGDNEVLLTLVERLSTHALILKIPHKDANSVMEGIEQLKDYFGEKWCLVFQTITSDNGSEFARLAELKQDGTDVYFTHPYTSCERPVNERHNGILRRFLPKGTPLESLSADEISWFEDWMNQLPRKRLGYRTPEEVFAEHLDRIYTASTQLAA